MCLTDVRKVVKIVDADTAIVSGYRTVKKGSVKNIKVGDYVSVYGPMILGKETKEREHTIRITRKKTSNVSS